MPDANASSVKAVNTLPVLESPDYAMVRDAIAFVSRNWQDQPSLAAIAGHVGLDALAFQRRFTRLAGLTPKTFLQCVTLDHARRLLAEDGSVLQASFDLGLSGPGRLHDLFVTHEAMTPGEIKRRGEGLALRWGLHPTPFGLASVVAKGGLLAGIGFVESEAGTDEDAIGLFRRRWPFAEFIRDEASTAPLADRVFDRSRWIAGEPLRIVMIGTDFEIRVWQALLDVPFAGATSYSRVAERIGRPTASRAVGAAVGRNPISFVVPCHRVLGKNGSLTGYMWGLPRKRAILGWEAGIATEAAPTS